MSDREIGTVNKCENEAEQAVLEARKKAEQMIKEAEREGRKLLSDTVAKAREEAADFIRESSAAAAEAAQNLKAGTDNKRAAMTAKAEARMDEAASFIAGRIIDSL
jgi:V/A-type H+-transporting ATPase subunit G/H